MGDGPWCHRESDRTEHALFTSHETANHSVNFFLSEKLNVYRQVYFIFMDSKITVSSDCSHEIKTLAPWKKSCDKCRQLIKKQNYHLADKGLYSQSYGSSNSHVQIGELNHKKG